MTSTKASALFEIGSVSKDITCVFSRPYSRTKNAPATRFQRGGRCLRRLQSSTEPDPPTGTVQDLLEDFNSEKLLKNVQDKWDNVEDKTTFLIYVGGSVFVFFLGTSVVSAFDNIPLLPKFFQLVGLLYSSWFIYRYLLFKSSRQELSEDVNELKKKISGGQ
eukprot:g6504.t1